MQLMRYPFKLEEVTLVRLDAKILVFQEVMQKYNFLNHGVLKINRVSLEHSK